LNKIWLMFLLLLFIFLGCDDLERDNLLDPKNARGYTDQQILVELFVNDSTGFDYCEQALIALEQISESAEFKNRICVIEYHLDLTSVGFSDPLGLAVCNDRYHQYVPNRNDRGVPDAFFNGLTNRVQGASSMQQIKNHYLEVLNNLTGKKSYFKIEASKNIVGASIEIEAKIARLGNSGKDDVTVQVVLFDDRGLQGQRNVVRNIFPAQSIQRINAGEVRTMQFSGNVGELDNPASVYTLIIIQNQHDVSKPVYQVVKF